MFLFIKEEEGYNYTPNIDGEAYWREHDSTNKYLLFNFNVLLIIIITSHRTPLCKCTPLTQILLLFEQYKLTHEISSDFSIVFTSQFSDTK